MCANHPVEDSSFFGKIFQNTNLLFAIAIVLGICTGYANIPALNEGAQAVSHVFINLLKLVSLPIIFLSLIATASSMEDVSEIKNLGKRVIKYTLLTTILAATVALGFFLLINPVQSHIDNQALAQTSVQGSYVTYLLNVIPSNIVQPFVENNVIGVLILAMLLSFAILTLPVETRKVLHTFFSGLYGAIMKITTWVVRFMPIAIWAFITLFILDMHKGLELKSLALYLACVLLANLFQGFVVLPLLLKWKQLSPVRMAKGMLPALYVAFFTKSSSATLPMAMKCAEERLGVSRKIASFSLPLCTTINMNGCAGFILITVLFVSMSNGISFSMAEMLVWIFIATIAAVGNAGVPMGCYFLASAFLAAMNVPLNILGVILPFYTLIDMVETAINVWSDSCVTAIVHKEVEGTVAVDDKEYATSPT